MDTNRDVVYIVDDDTDVRQSLAAALTAAGYTVEAYSRADEFLANDCGNEPHCLVVDLLMPGMTGLQLCQEIVSRKAGWSFVMVSGSADAPRPSKSCDWAPLISWRNRFAGHDSSRPLVGPTRRFVPAAKHAWQKSIARPAFPSSRLANDRFSTPSRMARSLRKSPHICRSSAVEYVPCVSVANPGNHA